MSETYRLQPTFPQVRPAEVRYIKLGAGGAFAQECFDANEIGIWFPNVPHGLCAASDWGRVRQIFLTEGKTGAKASDHVRELRTFYEAGSDTLWITFAAGRLWWAFAEPGVVWRDDCLDRIPRRRRVIGAWRSTDSNGQPLIVRRLSTRLTKVAAYQSTICEVEERDYLLRKLNGEVEPIVLAAEIAEAHLNEIAIKMIRRLHERDFELLIDLIFAASGWRRVSVLGETEKDIDLLVEQIATGERAFVQVKSAATPAVLEDYLARYRAYDDVQRFVFACHSPTPALERRTQGAPSEVALWFADTLAQKAVRAGLFNWLIERVR